MKRRLLLLLALGFLGSPPLRGMTLEEALARALERNPRIQKAKTAVEQAAGQRLVLRSIALPVASIRAPAGVQGGKRAGQAPNEPFAFAQGSFGQPLFYAAIPASLRRGEIEGLVAAQELNVAVVDQLHEVRTAFYTALYNRSLEELGRSQRQRLDENLTSEEARYAAGTVDRGALAAATLQARELDPQIEDAHRTYGAAILQLATAMGDDLAPGAALPWPRGTLDFKPVNFPLESETSAALERRADLRLARLIVRAAREDERIVDAAYYPRLDLTLFGRYIPKTDLRQPGAPSTTNLVSSEILGGASCTWRVIDNGKVSGASLRQQSVREMNELQLQKLETSVARELAGLTNNFRAIAARHDSLSKAVEVAEKNVAVVEQSWQQGLASQLEFRRAETDLLATRGGILKAAFQQEMTRAEWDRATGRYFQFSDDAAAKVHSPKQ
jgi:outer membrane protein TolC